METEERLEQVERIIDELIASEDQYIPLKSLLDSLPVLLKIDESILSYRKKVRDLKEQLKQNKALIKNCSDNLHTYESRAKTQLEAATKKRDKDNRTLSTRLASVQNTITQMILDNQLSVKTHEVHVKQESNTIIQQLEGQLKSHISAFEGKLKPVWEDWKSYHQRLTEGASKILEDIKGFEEGNKRKIETMQKQGRGNDITKVNGKDNLRNWLFREISARLDKGIENCRKTFDDKFKNLNLEYNKRLLSLRSDVESLREGTSSSPTNVSICSTEQIIESARKMTTQLAGYFAEKYEKIELSVKNHEEIVGNIQDGEEINEIRDKKFEFSKSKREVKELEDKVDSDIYSIQDSLKKASLLFSESDDKGDKSKEGLQKVKRVQSSFEMNKKNIREKIKAIYLKTNDIEARFAELMKRDKIESQDNKSFSLGEVSRG